MNYAIEIYSPTNVLKKTCTPNSPKGFVESVIVSLSKEGDCLESTFQAIPQQLGIANRDIVKLRVDGVVKYTGYINNYPNPDSKNVHTYSVIGLKKLLYQSYVDLFWSHGANISLIISDLNPHIPSYIDGSIINQAPTDVTVGERYVASHQSLGAILDDLVSRCGPSYSWGVNGEGRVFVSPRPTNVINLQNPPNKVFTPAEANDETIVTAVKFFFSVPEDLVNNEFNSKHSSFNRLSEGQLQEQFQPREISYTYRDAAAIGQYGEFTTSVPLVLTESWMRKETPQTYAQRKGYHVNWSNIFNISTHADSSAAADLISAVSDNNYTGTYIKNRTDLDMATIVFEIVKDSAADAKTFASGKKVDVDDIVGVEFHTQVDNSGKPLLIRGTYHYRKGRDSTQASVGDALQDQNQLETSNSFNGLSKGTYRTLIRRRSFLDHKTNPADVNDEINHFTCQFGLYSTSLLDNPDMWRLYQINLISVNTDLLDEYGKSLIKTPTYFPAQISTSTDLGLGAKATVRPNLDVDVSKVQYEISRNNGYRITYFLDNDPSRDNLFAQRIMERDQTAKVDSFRKSKGGF